jgi:hypothetical protein
MRIEKTGENFSIHKKIDEPITYYINIVGTVPSIESPHLEKFRTQ